MGASMRAFTAALMVMVLLATTTVAARSVGQTPPSSSSSGAGAGAGNQAVRHYEDGVRAAKLALWSKAYASFLTAWRLKQHYQIAANLGRAELELRKYRDAAEHLTYFLREASDVHADEREAAQAMLDEARANVGALTIIVDRAGAEVLIDGVAVGKAPLAHEIFVDPGQRAIAAKLGGFDDDQRLLNVAAGSSPRILLMPTPAAGAGSSPADSKSAPTPAPMLSSSDAQSAGTARTTIIATGITGAAVATGLGVVSVVIASANGSDAQAILDSCRGRVCETHGAPAEHNELASDKATFQNVAVWSFIGAGALGASTIIYALVTSSPKSTSSLTASVLPTSGGGGVLVTASW